MEDINDYYILPVGDIESTTSVVYSLFNGSRVKLHITFENADKVEKYLSFLRVRNFRENFRKF